MVVTSAAVFVWGCIGCSICGALGYSCQNICTKHTHTTTTTVLLMTGFNGKKITTQPTLTTPLLPKK